MHYELYDVSSTVPKPYKRKPLYLLVDLYNKSAIYVHQDQNLNSTVNLINNFSDDLETFKIDFEKVINWGDFDTIEEAHNFIKFNKIFDKPEE